MTDKELRRLRRTELLEMMIEQKRAADEAEKALGQEKALREQAENELRQMRETCERLRRRLDEQAERSLAAQSAPAPVTAQGEISLDADTLRTLDQLAVRVELAVITAQEAARNAARAVELAQENAGGGVS